MNGIGDTMNLNKLVKPQDDALLSRATILSGPNSPVKQPYPDGKHFTLRDIIELIKHTPMLVRMAGSLVATIRMIEGSTEHQNKIVTPQDMADLRLLCTKLGIDSIGWLRLRPDRIYEGKGVPYPVALILTMNMNKVSFRNAPSMEAQLEVMRVYGETGRAANTITSFLHSRCYNAAPNHPMGGSIDYACAGVEAGLGGMGRHGMLITPEGGACHRSSVVYTDIENLGDFFPAGPDHSWIHDFCISCGACIHACPTQAIRQEPLPDGRCNARSVDYDRCCEGFRSYGCGVCIRVCPFTTAGYDTIKGRYEKIRNRKIQDS
jgi:epoxyqueuosine reductase